MLHKNLNFQTKRKIWKELNIKRDIITTITIITEKMLRPWVDYSSLYNSSRGQIRTHGFFILIQYYEFNGGQKSESVKTQAYPINASFISVGHT
jgi:hypothetical protein